jgi:hypothetical protein
VQEEAGFLDTRIQIEQSCSPAELDAIVCNLTEEIQALQAELGKLVYCSSKQKNSVVAHTQP